MSVAGNLAVDSPIEWKDIDRQIWEEELKPVVPQKIFDVHTHAYRREHIRGSSPELQSFTFAELYQNAGWDDLEAADALLLPGRQIHRLVFGFPFRDVNFEPLNGYTINEVRKDPESAALLLVNPGMSAQYVERQVLGEGFVGFKPYRLYTSTGNPKESRITDFFPEHQIEVAERYGLLVILQLSKSRGIGDPENIADLTMLSSKYPNVRWIMAHCCRGFYPQPLERAGQRLADLPNVYVDTAAVCEYGSYDYLLSLIGPERILYGSDNLPACADRGKYITWGEAWAHMNGSTLQTTLPHCDGSMTFILYEVLRALCRAIRRHGLSRSQIEGIFHDNAANLLAGVRQRLTDLRGQ